MKRMKRPDPNPVKVEERGVRSDPVPALERIAKNLEEKPRSDGGDKWYKKPVGIVVLSVAATTIALLVRALLRHRFPGIIP